MSVTKTLVAIRVRVSTVEQETARQVSETHAYTDGKNYEVVEVCEETIPGSAEDGERHRLRPVEELARADEIEQVFVHEVSRRAHRNTLHAVSHDWAPMHSISRRERYFHCAASNRVGLDHSWLPRRCLRQREPEDLWCATGPYRVAVEGLCFP